MKKIILASLILLSCNNKVDQSNTQKKSILKVTTETTLIKNDNLEPLFFGLYPEMSYQKFENEISKNNDDFTDKEFIILVKNDELNFSVRKMGNSIKLQYNNFQKIKYENLNKEKSLYFLNKNEQIINDLTSLYKNNYTNFNNINLPLNSKKDGYYGDRGYTSISSFRERKIRRLNYYGFKQERYKIFRDSIKTVLLGYTSKGRIIESEEEMQKIIKYYKSIKNPDAIQKMLLESQIDELYKTHRNMENFEDSQKFELLIEIDYLRNETFDQILLEMEEDKKRVDKINLERQTEKDNKNSKLKENLKKI